MSSMKTEDVSHSDDQPTPEGAVKDSDDRLTPEGAVKDFEDQMTPEDAVKDSEDQLTPEGAVKDSEDRLTPEGAVKDSEDRLTPEGTVKDYDDQVTPVGTDEAADHHEESDDLESKEKIDLETIDDDKQAQESSPELILEPVDPAILMKLSQGLLENFLPDVQKAKSTLQELTQNQRILVDTVQQENTKFHECKAFEQLAETMTQAKKYHAKLLSIKKEMALVHDRSAKLKRRAVRLQQQKQKEELQKAQQRERELEKERMLTAKMAKRAPKQ